MHRRCLLGALSACFVALACSRGESSGPDAGTSADGGFEDVRPRDGAFDGTMRDGGFPLDTHTQDARLDAAPDRAEALVGRYFVHTHGYHVTRDGAATEVFLKLGWTHLRAGSASIEYFLYRANENRPPVDTTHVHPPMLSCPYLGGCAPGRIRIPTYSASKMWDGTWSFDGSLLRVQIGTVVHEWRQESVSPYGFLLERYVDASTGRPEIGGATYGEFVGYGFLADEARSRVPLDWGELEARYEGEFVAGTSPPGSPWTLRGDSLSIGLFDASSDPNVRGYARDCGDGLRCGSFGMWCLNSLLLNYAPVSTLMVYMNGGHDFDCSGCYGDVGETGHSLQLMAVRRGGRIEAFAYVEHSWESDGFPLLRVGRFFLRR